VHVNVDGSQYTDPVCAGAGILVHGPDGKPSWLSPDTALLEHRVRVCGSQDNARAEMLAMYAGLRACRQVPQVKMHSDCSYVLDTMTKYWKDDGRPSLKPFPRTTNADLITVIVRELVRRDASHGPGHISLHKVESHIDDTPIDHVDVDIIAKEAATLPLPAQWQKLLPSQYTVMHEAGSRREKERR
jgi:ribonuclease HI